jgi:hypothetical protein
MTSWNVDDEVGLIRAWMDRFASFSVFSVGKVGTVCVLLCIIGVDHVWWMMGFTPIQAWMPSFTVIFGSSQGWQGCHSCWCGLHVVGFDHVWWMMGFTPIQAWKFYRVFDSSLGWQRMVQFGFWFACCRTRSCLVDDGFYTNPGLDGEFYRFFSILAWVGKVGTVCVLVCMLSDSIMFGG